MLITIGELIKQSWQLYRRHFQVLWVYILMIIIPTIIIGFSNVTTSIMGYLLPKNFGPSIGIVGLVVLACLIFLILVHVSLLTAIDQLISQQKARPWKEILPASLPLLWPYFYTSLAVGLIVIGGMFLLFIPGILFGVWFMFSSYAVVLSGQKGLAAMTVSKNLVQGRWWAIFWRSLIPVVLLAIVTVIIRSVLLGFGSLIFHSKFQQDILNSLLLAVTSGAIAPLSTSIFVLLYRSAERNPLSTQPSSSLTPPPIKA